MKARRFELVVGLILCADAVAVTDDVGAVIDAAAQYRRDGNLRLAIELRYPLLDRPAQGGRLFVIPFFDFGAAWNIGADPQDIRSIGVGLNWQFRGLSADLYYGYRLVDINIETGNNLQDNGISFQLRDQF